MSLRLGALDDDLSILYTLEAMALSLSWEMKVTADPLTALDWVRSDEVDILLVDYHMPLMSGIEAIRRARELSSSVVLLALTVEESPEVARDLSLAGADDFVSKPLRLADFSSRIRLHGELVRYRRESRRDLPRKGIAEETSRRVLDLLRGEGLSLDVRAVAASLGLAYPTAHRYLEFLVEKGQVRRVQEDPEGKPGRPRSLYRFVGS
ncbi:response regulator [Aminithiophilus ramosus]|uniref:Response regulator n=2 Tax=Synergistales TaxID=649776 RepID=A0A9Q7F002_9BACT|nr:response regulator [Aminithiophilus ramosus]QTX32697.1 response regulator [Aminithiophilus ramosus]QVL36573.1 response regulator [Synergistota bacterium]